MFAVLFMRLVALF